MRKAFVILTCLFLLGCASAARKADPQLKLSKNELQEELTKSNAQIESLKVIIAEQEAKLKAKDAKIEELKKKLSSFGVFE